MKRPVGFESGEIEPFSTGFAHVRPDLPIKVSGVMIASGARCEIVGCTIRHISQMSSRDPVPCEVLSPPTRMVDLLLDIAAGHVPGVSAPLLESLQKAALACVVPWEMNLDPHEELRIEFRNLDSHTATVKGVLVASAMVHQEMPRTSPRCLACEHDASRHSWGHGSCAECTCVRFRR